MTTNYEPEVNDYVILDQGEHGITEGWVYFKCPIIEEKKGFNKTPRYITIETHVSEKPPCKYSKNLPHKKNHCLVLCYESDWKYLKFVKRRKSQYDETIILESENTDNNTYKSQEYRDQDLY